MRLVIDSFVKYRYDIDMDKFKFIDLFSGIGKYKRRLSVREAARLQSFPDSFIFDDNMRQAYKHSVNVEIFKRYLGGID